MQHRALTMRLALDPQVFFVPLVQLFRILRLDENSADASDALHFRTSGLLYPPSALVG